MTRGIGTLLWSAPELLAGKPYGPKVDIYRCVPEESLLLQSHGARCSLLLCEAAPQTSYTMSLFSYGIVLWEVGSLTTPYADLKYIQIASKVCGGTAVMCVAYGLGVEIG